MLSGNSVYKRTMVRYNMVCCVRTLHAFDSLIHWFMMSCCAGSAPQVRSSCISIHIAVSSQSLVPQHMTGGGLVNGSSMSTFGDSLAASKRTLQIASFLHAGDQCWLSVFGQDKVEVWGFTRDKSSIEMLRYTASRQRVATLGV